MNNVIETANELAMKNDRWLFLATLLIFGVAVFFAFRWLVGKHEKLVSEQRTDQQQYTTSLLNITAEGNRTSRDLLSVLEKNTNAIENNTEIVERCRAMLSIK